jgi:hypothetical protein
MGTKNNPAPNDYYENALPDEPMFTLLARDPHAPDLVIAWADKRHADIRAGKRPESDMPIVQEALDCARAIIEWRRSNDGAWRKPATTAAA